jgi:hypothetical protein
VVRALERMLAMRAYQREKHVDGRINLRCWSRSDDPGEVEEMYHVMAIANYEDRFVIPTTHREYAENTFDLRGGCGFSFGNGCSDGASEASLFGGEKAHHSHQGGGLSHGTRPQCIPEPAGAGPLLSYPDAELRAHVPDLRDRHCMTRRPAARGSPN